MARVCVCARCRGAAAAHESGAGAFNDRQIYLTGGLTGLAEFAGNVTRGEAKVFKTKLHKVVHLHVGEISIFMTGGNHEPDSALSTQLTALYTAFCFFHGSFDRLRQVRRPAPPPARPFVGAHMSARPPARAARGLQPQALLVGAHARVVSPLSLLPAVTRPRPRHLLPHPRLQTRLGASACASKHTRALVVVVVSAALGGPG